MLPQYRCGNCVADCMFTGEIVTNAPDILSPTLEVREAGAEHSTPVPALTHDEQIAEYVRLVEEARMRT